MPVHPARPRSAIVRRSQQQPAEAPSSQESEPSTSSSSSGAAPKLHEDAAEEVVFYEGSGSNAELALNVLMLPTLIFAPLSIASIGRRLWIKFRFTNKRVCVINSSPLFSRTIEIAYKNIKEVRTVQRMFGAWGDMVIFLRDGSRIELRGVDKFKEIEEHINRCIFTM